MNLLTQTTRRDPQHQGEGLHRALAVDRVDRGCLSMRQSFRYRCSAGIVASGSIRAIEGW